MNNTDATYSLVLVLCVLLGASAAAATPGTSPGDGFTPTEIFGPPARPLNCETLGLPGYCIDVTTDARLDGIRQECPGGAVKCRIVIQPGHYKSKSAHFDYRSKFRHFIGVPDVHGKRPIIESNGQAVITNKGSHDTTQSVIVEKLVLRGTGQGVDFSGTTFAPFDYRKHLAWLHDVRIETTSRSIFFNGNRADRDGENGSRGHGSLWCTQCELVNRPPPGKYRPMISIGEIDSVFILDTVFRSTNWGKLTIKIGARSIKVVDSEDEAGRAVGCGVRNIRCRDSGAQYDHYLRAPTREWFEAEVDALAD